MCGESSTWSPRFRSELSRASGSSSNTSSAAPPICPRISASVSAASRTHGPRDVLIKIAVGFMSASCAASIMCRVSRVSTTCRLTTSDSRSSVGRSTRVTPCSSNFASGT